MPITSLEWKGKVKNQNNPSLVPPPLPPPRKKEANKYKKKKQQEINSDYIERKEYKSKISVPNAKF